MEFLNMNDVLKKLKISKSFLYRLLKNDESFPKSIKLSPKRNKVWMKDDIEKWMSNKFYTQLNLFDHHHAIGDVI
jgi:predicted DNA-binding transcriptional regulator AlpA